jgi:hypothetical protein
MGAKPITPPHDGFREELNPMLRATGWDYPGFLAVTIQELESITTPFGPRKFANSFFKAAATTSCWRSASTPAAR